MPPVQKGDREALRKVRCGNGTFLGLDIGRATCSISIWEEGDVRTLAGFQHTDPMVPAYTLQHGALSGHAAYKQWKHNASDGAMLPSPLHYFAASEFLALARSDTTACQPSPDKPSKKDAKTALENLLSTLLSIAVEEHRCGTADTCHLFVSTPSWLSVEQEVVYITMLSEAALKLGVDSLTSIPERETAILSSHLRQERQLTKLWFSERILIIDVGYGASATLVEINGGDHQIIWNSSDATLGGNEIDRLLYGFFVAQLRKQQGLPAAPDSSFLSQSDQVVLLQNIRLLKEGLSGGQKQTVDMTGFAGIAEFSLTMSRAMMEMTCISVWKGLKKFLELPFASSSSPSAPSTPSSGQNIEKPCTKSSLNEVILIGGSSKIPKIQSEVQKMFSSQTVSAPAAEGGVKSLSAKKSLGALRLKARIAGKSFHGGEPPKLGASDASSSPTPASPTGSAKSQPDSPTAEKPVSINVFLPPKPDHQVSEGAALACQHTHKRRELAIESPCPSPHSPAPSSYSSWGSPMHRMASTGSPSQSPTGLNSTTRSLSALTLLSEGLPSTIGVAVAGNSMCPILKKFTEIGGDGSLTRGVVLELRTQQRVQIDVLQGERRKATDNSVLSSFFVYLIDATKIGKEDNSVMKRICVQFTYTAESLVVEVWVQGASHISEKKVITRELYTVLESGRVFVESKFTPALPSYTSSLAEGFIRQEAALDNEDEEIAHKRTRRRDKAKAQAANFERYKTRIDTNQRTARDELLAMEKRIRNKMILLFTEKYLRPAGLV